jgi:Family of unknown function (DUF6152)
MNDRIRYTVLIVVAATLGLGISVSLSAHHGTAIAYDIQHPITLKGTVTEFRFANPHCQIYFDVTDDKGQVVNWAGELNSTYSLIQDGWTRKRSVEALKPGTSITVIVLPGRSGNPVGLAQKIFNAKGEQILSETNTGLEPDRRPPALR